MDYKEKYEMALEGIQEILGSGEDSIKMSRLQLRLQGIFPELKESENKRMIQYFKDLAPFDKADELYEKYGFSHKDAIAWLEEQGEHANFRNKIQVGDKVTRNKDGVLVNLSQLNRVAKKQGEQKPAWSEEDDKIIEEIINDIECARAINYHAPKEGYEFRKNWLKSLKARYTWKPSDEQMADLWNMLCECRPADHQLLQDIYYGLKKLREE